MAKRALLITGATGNQGGAVIQALLDDGPEDWEIRALVRDPSSDRAKALQAEGVHLVRGDLDDDRSVAEAVQGAYGVFSVQGFRPQGVAAEEEQGKRLATAAARAGVGHFVYASAGGAGSNSGVPTSRASGTSRNMSAQLAFRRRSCGRSCSWRTWNGRSPGHW